MVFCCSTRSSSNTSAPELEFQAAPLPTPEDWIVRRLLQACGPFPASMRSFR